MTKVKSNSLVKLTRNNNVSFRKSPFYAAMTVLTLAVSYISAQTLEKQEMQTDSLNEVTEVPTHKKSSSLKTHNFGLAAGFLSGYGFSYRHWFPSKNGYQITFIPAGKVTENEGYFNSSLGLLGLKSLHESEHTNFFGYYGAHYNFEYQNEKKTFNGPSNNSVPYEHTETIHELYTGLGVGIEIHFWNLNYSLIAGYAANFMREQIIDPYPNYYGYYYSSYQPTPNDTDWKNSFEMQPSIETALFYAF